jgi:hypothetical protein
MNGKNNMRRLFPIQILALMAVIAVYTSYAYASSESPTPGGEGVNTISGWNISSIQYHLEDGLAKNSAVEFDLDGSADMVKVSVQSSSATFYDCTNTIGTHWYCSIGAGSSISEFDELRVIAK